MPMRDDRDALRARVDALTEDLDVAQRERDAAEEKLDLVTASAAERDRLVRELADARRSAPRRDGGRRAIRSPVTLLVLALIVVAVGAAILITMELADRRHQELRDSRLRAGSPAGAATQ